MDLRPHRATLGLLPVLAAGMLLLGHAVGPSSSTETRYCAMGREMAASGDLIVPTFNGAPLLEKPPFIYWGTSTAFRLFGVGDVVARLPQLLAAALVLLVTAWIARRLAPEGDSGRWRGTLAALALATMPSFLVQAYAIAPDVWLLLSTTTAGAALLEADRAPGRAPRRWALLLHGAMGLGMLAKGPLTLGLALGAALVTAAIRRRARILKPFVDPWGLLLFAALSAPWYLALDARIPGLLASLVERRLFGTLAVAADFHVHGPWIVWLPFLGTLPWTAMLPGAIRQIASRGRWRDGVGLPIVALALAAPVLFTFSAARLPSYGSPAYPWLAVLLALGAPAPSADASVPGARLARVQFGRATLATGLLAGAIGLGALAAAAGLGPVRVAWPYAAAAAAAGVAAIATTFLPRPSATMASPVPRAATAVTLLLVAAGFLAADAPARVGAAGGIWSALARHRAPDEPIAVALNYNGDWGLLPWHSRGEVLFFGYPSDPMMVPPEAYRPDLFRPAAELEPWLQGPGRRWLMLRPRSLKKLAAAGVPLTTVATVHEYVLVATKPLDAPTPR
jgi:4-amino-4-deoxy-L-arabinose transferase-like glycosyltransferase